MKHLTNRSIGLSIFICLILFCFLSTLSFSYYPGGNNFHPLTEGHSFWLNFWCDLLSEQTLNQIPNPARPFAVVAAFFLILGLFITGINSNRFFSISKNQYRLMVGLGLLSILSSPGVNYYHDTFLTVSANSGLLAFTLFVYFSFKTPYKLFAMLGLLALLTGTINFILWMMNHQTILLPVIQKISTVFLVLWMFAGSLILMKKKSN